VTSNDPNGAEGAPTPEEPKRAGGPGAFTEEEVAAVTAAPLGDPELDDVEAADLDGETDVETPFEKLVAKSKRLSAAEVRTVLESVLFVTDKSLTVDQLFEATGIDRKRIQDALEKLQGTRREGISGIVLHEVSGGWQLRTDPGSAEYVRRFLKVKPQRLTRAGVETLAMIAYRQPVTRPEIEDLRGVDSGAVIKALLERRLIKILGKKEEVGRPILYGTTREFLEFFALKDLSSLPTLREFHELSEEHQEIVEKEAPPPKTAEGTISELADPAFAQRLEEQTAASEAALEELEAAMVGADATSRAAATLLDPKPVGTEVAPEGGAAPAASETP
jgi:segregation and condensation protein B